MGDLDHDPAYRSQDADGDLTSASCSGMFEHVTDHPSQTFGVGNGHTLTRDGETRSALGLPLQRQALDYLTDVDGLGLELEVTGVEPVGGENVPDHGSRLGCLQHEHLDEAVADDRARIATAVSEELGDAEYRHDRRIEESGGGRKELFFRLVKSFGGE